MQEKQKVTLYIPPELHRRLKIKAAVDSDPMSAIVERAVVLYLDHPEIRELPKGAYGRTHRVHSCPECDGSLVMKDGELVSLKGKPTMLSEEKLQVLRVRSVKGSTASPGEEELVPC